MLKKLPTGKIVKLYLILLLMGAVASAYGQNNEIFSTVSGSSTNTISDSLNKSKPNSFVALDFSIKTGESWDEKDYRGNVVANCFNGSVVTGFEYTNITLQTFGVSRFSDAIFYVSSSNTRDNSGLQFKVAGKTHLTGTSVFSSDGIIDISDSGNNDVVALADQKFIIQFYEDIDDNPNAIDTQYNGGILKIWGVDLTPSETCPFIKKAVSESNLSVAYSVASEKVAAIDDLINLQITVTNSGAGEAVDVVMENTFSDQLDLINFSCSDGTVVTDEASLATVKLENIQPNSTLTCGIEAKVIGLGRVNNSVLVTASNNSNITNNLATLVINGSVIVVPVNNKIALFLLFFIIILFSKKAIKS